MENNSGCNSLFAGIVIAIAVVIAIVISIAGVKSAGFFGIFYGPVALLIGFAILSFCFSAK